MLRGIPLYCADSDDQDFTPASQRADLVSLCLHVLQVPNDPSRPDGQPQGSHPPSASTSAPALSQSQQQSSVATTVLAATAETRSVPGEPDSVSADTTTVCPTVQVHRPSSLCFCTRCMLILSQFASVATSACLCSQVGNTYGRHAGVVLQV